MMNHAQCKDLFVEALYGELPESQSELFTRHMNSCAECAGEFAELRGVKETMSLRERDELRPEDWVAFWNTLSPELDQIRRGPSRASRSHWPFPRFASLALRIGAVAAVFLLAGLLMGRFIGIPGWDGTAIEEAAERLTVEQAAVREEALGYLERSKVLLLGIINGADDTPEPEVLSRKQEFSRMLVSEGGDLKNRLSKNGEQQLMELVGDLEVILLQIANLQAEHDFPGIEVVRGGVDRKGILLKINVQQMKAGTGSAAVPKPKQESHTIPSMI